MGKKYWELELEDVREHLEEVVRQPDPRLPVKLDDQVVAQTLLLLMEKVGGGAVKGKT